MSLVLGTNCGFVTEAPTADPDGNASYIDSFALALKVVAPLSGNIVKMGWYCSNESENVNFQMGIYAHDSGNNRPGNLLGSSGDIAKGTTTGWKEATGLNILVTAGNTYWIAVQIDDTTPATGVDRTSTSDVYHFKLPQTSLPNPWGTSSGNGNLLYAVYALYTTTQQNKVLMMI